MWLFEQCVPHRLACLSPRARVANTPLPHPYLPAAGELLHMSEPFLEKNIHPTVIVKGYAKVRPACISPHACVHLTTCMRGAHMPLGWHWRMLHTAGASTASRR